MTEAQEITRDLVSMMMADDAICRRERKWPLLTCAELFNLSQHLWGYEAALNEVQPPPVSPELVYARYEHPHFPWMNVQARSDLVYRMQVSVCVFFRPLLSHLPPSSWTARARWCSG